MKTATKPKTPKKPADPLVAIAIDANAAVQNGNWVGALQEACLKHRVAVPTYEFHRKSNTPDHAAMFMCEVVVANRGETSLYAATKAIAKKLAAEAWVKCWMMQ